MSLSSLTSLKLPQLTSPETWIQWSSMIKTTAMDNDVWEYCDPDSTKTVVRPQDLTGNPTVTQERLYTIKVTEHERVRKGLAKVNSTIQGTVCTDYQTYLEDAHTPRERLTRLRTAIKPSTRQMEDSIREEYENLLKGPKRVGIDKWLNRWIALAPRLRAMSIPNLAESQACKGFIQASESINQAFYNSAMNDLDKADTESHRVDHLKQAMILVRNSLQPSESSSNTIGTAETSPPAWHHDFDSHLEAIKEKSDPHKLTLAQLVGRFKSMQPSKQASKQIRASFATFQGRKHDRTDDSDEESITSSNDVAEKPRNRSKKAKKQTNSEKTALMCICGFKHRYPDCYHLNPSSAPKQWKPNDQVISKIISAASGNRQLDRSIRNALKKANIQPPEWYPNRETSKLADAELSVHATGRAAFAIQQHVIATSRSSYDQDLFRLDSCADTHVCNDRSRFYTFRPTSAENVNVGDTTTSIQGLGSVTITIKGPHRLEKIDLHNVAYCPGFHINLVSYIRLKAKGVRWNDTIGWLMCEGHKFAKIVDQEGWPIIEASTNQHAMATSSRLPLSSSASMERWHARLGHIRLETLKHLSSSVDGVTITSNDLQRDSELCPECTQGQQRRQIHRISSFHGSYPFERVYFDLIEVEEAYNTERWILHFYCAFSGFHVVFTLRSKLGYYLAQSTETFIKLAKAWGYTIREVQSDSEQSLNTQWYEIIHQNGITYRPSPPATQDQNGAAERSGGVIVTIARKIYLESRLPIKLWPHFVNHAARILNRVPMQRKQWVTPYEIVYHRRPNLAGFRVTGSKAYVLIKDERKRPKTHKLRSKSIIGYIVGVESANIFIVWIPELQRVIRARDVEIDEKDRYQPDKQAQLSPTDITELNIAANTIDIDDTEHSEYHQHQAEEQAGLSNQTQSIPTPEPEQNTTPLLERGEIETPELSQPSPVQLQSPQASPQPIAQRQSQPTAIDALRNLRTSTGRAIKPSAKASQALNSTMATKRSFSEMENQRHSNYCFAIQHLHQESGLRQAFAAATAHSIRPHISQLPNPPDGWAQMLKHPEAQGFKEAAQAEMDQHTSNKTWQMVPSPQDNQVLPLRWVFSYKFDPEGYLTRYKARLCVRGDLQWPTHEDIFAATGAYRTLRILLAIVAAFGLICEQGDVKNAFTKANLDHPTYTHTAQGYRQPGMAYMLLKALYGLKISPKLWYTELSNKLQSLGFRSCPEDPCLFIHAKNGIIIFVYVDDMLFIAHPSRRESLEELKKELHTKYGIQDVGPASSFLNIRIIRDGRKLWLLQDSYIEKLATKFKQTNSHVVKTPLSSSFQPIPYTGQATPQQIMAYQQRIGSLIYPAIITRPDIAFAVSSLSQYNQNPSPEHLLEANRIISYLYHSRYLAIQYTNDDYERNSNEGIFQAAGDASFADDTITRKSSQGYILSLFKGPIAWQASKQRTVTTSTTEAELLSLSHTAREVISVIRLFSQIAFDPEQMPIIHCDNQQTVGLIQKERPQLTTKLKHIDIHHHWLRQARTDGLVEIQWVPTNAMPADGLTKRLSKGKQASFIKALGMVNIAEKLGLPDTNDDTSDDEVDDDNEASIRLV